MATFITNIKFTQQGIKDIDHSTKRAAIFKTEAKKLGAKVKEIYWTLGDHDGLLILEARMTKQRLPSFCIWERWATSTRQLAELTPLPRWKRS